MFLNIFASENEKHSITLNIVKMCKFRKAHTLIYLLKVVKLDKSMHMRLLKTISDLSILNIQIEFGFICYD